MDNNPVFAATETTNSSAKQASLVSRTEGFGRYSFYLKDVMSISPEMKFAYTRHQNREDDIRRNDNWVLVGAVRTSYEHSYNKKPASFLFDYDYVYSHRDIKSNNNLVFNSRVQTFTVGERIQGLIGDGETTIRTRYRTFDSFSAAANSKTQGLALEHIKSSSSGMLWIYNFGLDRTTVETDSFNTNTLFLRADVILPPTKSWKITPQLGLGVTLTDPYNNQDRGLETTLNPSFRISKSIGNRTRVNVHADYMQNNSKDKKNFAYQKTFYGAEIEYLF
jgi:hypothetical protein